jgi:hypothetical protein
MRDLAHPLLAGDSHGDFRHFSYLIERAKSEGCDGILHCGDLGYYPNIPEFAHHLELLDRWLQAADLWLYFVDGNHEAHWNLRALPREGPFTRTAYKRIVHIPRGARWTWHGIRYLGLGGAYSIDKEKRTLGLDWFPEEQLSQAEIYRILQAPPGGVDVIIAHDCPAGIEFHGLLPIRRSDSNRLAVQAVVEHARPKLVVHGHHHVAHHSRYRSTEQSFSCDVVGLSHNRYFDRSKMERPDWTPPLCPAQLWRRSCQPLRLG